MGKAAWRKAGIGIGFIMIAVGLLQFAFSDLEFVPPRFPTVYDEANLFDLDQLTGIDQYHAKLLQDHDIDYRVLTVKNDTPTDINQLSHTAFREQEVGSFSKSGRGLLLLIDAGQNEVRLEVSAALEPVYTDAFISYLQHRQMIPFFRTDRIADGILATTELIFTRAQDAAAGKEFIPPMESKSIGGGAANPANIGKGADNSFQNAPDVRAESNDPSVVLQAYLAAREKRNANPSLSIYSAGTRAMLKKWTVTPAQMDNEARSIRRCGAGETRIGDGYAVIRYAPKERQCSPFFFVFEDGAWRLDLTMMQKAMRFNHRNQWHFDQSWPPLSAPYGFAFRDWRFDRYGFPHPPK
ncbi:MAG: TPM domain-containing protein [Alphaproteobacteria bacterium]|nr:MAG: TPM domain-containing protein [Alphaproteobacteria bacterium]